MDLSKGGTGERKEKAFTEWGKWKRWRKQFEWTGVDGFAQKARKAVAWIEAVLPPCFLGGKIAIARRD